MRLPVTSTTLRESSPPSGDRFATRLSRMSRARRCTRPDSGPRSSIRLPPTSSAARPVSDASAERSSMLLSRSDSSVSPRNARSCQKCVTRRRRSAAAASVALPAAAGPRPGCVRGRGPPGSPRAPGPSGSPPRAAGVQRHQGRQLVNAHEVRFALAQRGRNPAPQRGVRDRHRRSGRRPSRHHRRPARQVLQQASGLPRHLQPRRGVRVRPLRELVHHPQRLAVRPQPAA